MVNFTEEQIKFWKENSYLFIPELFSKESQQISEWVDEVASWESEGNKKWLSFYEMDKPDQLSRRENFVPFHEGLAMILNGPEMLDAFSQLMGEPAFLYKDRLNFKYPTTNVTFLNPLSSRKSKVCSIIFFPLTSKNDFGMSCVRWASLPLFPAASIMVWYSEFFIFTPLILILFDIRN